MNDIRESVFLHAHNPDAAGARTVRDLLRRAGWRVTISDQPPADGTSFHIMTQAGLIDDIEGVEELIRVTRQT